MVGTVRGIVACTIGISCSWMVRYAAACGLVCWGDKAVHVAGCSVLAMGGSRVISVRALNEDVDIGSSICCEGVCACVCISYVAIFTFKYNI